MEQLAFPDLHLTSIEQLAQQEHERAKDMDARMKWLIEWLIKTHRCTRDIVPYVERLYREFSMAEAPDRAKALITLSHDEEWSLWDAKLMGIYDHSVDYHVLWNRSWAIQMLVPMELVPKVWKCSYGGQPKFCDREGNLLFQSIYSANGHVLTREERRKALEEAGAL